MKYTYRLCISLPLAIILLLVGIILSCITKDTAPLFVAIFLTWRVVSVEKSIPENQKEQKAHHVN